jgi:hypothetical protein
MFNVPPHLIDGQRVRFWRLRWWLRRMSWRLRRDGTDSA